MKKIVPTVLFVLVVSVVCVVLFLQNRHSRVAADAIDCTKTFVKPVPVEWTGKIIAQMVSGTQYGIEKVPADKENPYFYASQDPDKAFLENKSVGLEGMVTVKGNWTGTTDAYRNTIFGRCVPSVDILSIVELKN